ncbi:MAG: ankyrin repeat domain-containing protein [Legionella sp.]|jgi:ankyrin repeat protein
MTIYEKFALKAAIKAGDLYFVSDFLNSPAGVDCLRIPLHDGELDLLIHFAACCGQLEIICLILSKDYGLMDVPGSDNKTPLLYAAICGHVAVVEYLACLGADCGITSRHLHHPEYDKSAILYATERGHTRVVATLINYGVDYNQRIGSDRKHLIHIACKMGHLATLILFLTKKPSFLEITDAYGRTPLVYAVHNGRLNTVKQLVDLKANFYPEISNTEQSSLIYQALEEGHIDVAEFLINSGCDFNQIRMRSKTHIIHLAAQKGYYKIVKLLLEKQADLVQIKDGAARPPILLAALRHAEIVSLLISYGASLQQTFGNSRFNLIHIAASEGQLEVIKVLLDIDDTLVNCRDAYNQTPLMIAAIRGHTVVVNYLLSVGARLDYMVNSPRTTNHNKNALECALYYNNSSVVNAIVLHLTKNQSNNAILPYIKDEGQALDLMLIRPDLARFLCNDTRVAGLLNNDHCSINNNSIRWYKRAGRRNSFYAEFNLEKQTVNVFHSKEILGAGKYGTVRRFQNEQGAEIAVKSSRVAIGSDNRAATKLHSDIIKKGKFNREAYPEAAFSRVFEFEDEIDNIYFYSSRYLLPYVKGDTCGIFISKLTNYLELAEVILAIAAELDRIHCVGILHGDVHLGNIIIIKLIDKYDVRYIDFGFAYYVWAASANSYLEESNGKKWYAPELYNNNNQRIKPNRNQDVYALGMLFIKCLETHSETHKLLQTFPLIETFIRESVSVEPNNRPKLVNFCPQLRAALQQAKQEVVAAPNSVPAAVEVVAEVIESVVVEDAPKLSSNQNTFWSKSIVTKESIPDTRNKCVIV